MRRGAWAALAVVALGLTGCSDPGTPSDTLPTATSTSAEPTLEPLGPADFPVPDEARVQTEAGAKAMASYYLDLVDYYYANLPDGPPAAEWLVALSSSCEECTYYANLYADWESSGYRLTGGDASVESIQVVEPVAATADLSWFVRSSASMLLDAAGAEIVEGSSPESRLSGGIFFTWSATRSAWIANQLNLTVVP